MKRTISALLALMTVALCAASCGETAETPTAGGDVTKEENPTVTEAVTEAFDPLAYLPETDMGGWQMDILCHEDALSGTWTFKADAMNGEIINDAIYNRTKRIEERFNIKYNVFAVGDQWSTVGDKLRTSVAAGDDLCDMVIYYTYALQAAMVTGHLFHNMLEIPHIDFSNPWWHTEINDTFSLYGYLPAILSDYSINSYQYANLLVYNKVLAANQDVENLYDLVRNHKWTKDKFYSIIKDITNDSNGDGKMDVNDTYGYATNFGYHALTWAYAIGDMGVRLSEENGVELGYQNEKFANLSEWLYDLLYESKLTFEIGWDKPCDISWDENRVLFQAIWLNDLEKFREYESAYGLLPYPMYDENQEKYYTYDDCRCGAFGIPLTSSPEDVDKTGLILEALSADSYYNVIPQYLDTVVTSKLSRDEESLEMLDYIMAGRVYDIGYAIPDSRQYTWLIYNDLKRAKGNLTSTIEKYRSSTVKYYEKIIEAYKEMSELE
ncbi:MAG: hypothetical protein MJ175_04565 [Clostridia bacterium]|nr:hypothetical protein [Clostridia bacterium]